MANLDAIGHQPGLLERRRTIHVKSKKDEEEPQILLQFAERWAPNYYIERREGQVLSRGMLLKFDIFPSSKIVRTDVSISGGPNYRKINEIIPLCAVGQPTIHGIRTILNLLIGSPYHIKMQHQREKTLELTSLNENSSINDDDASDILQELNLLDNAMQLIPSQSILDSNQLNSTDQLSTGTCIWINLREEPVVYLNNRPFVLRDVGHPFRNIQTFKGITWKHLLEVEERLKRDVLKEASQHHNILIHKENEKHEVFPSWEAVNPQTIQTSQEAFKKMANEGYNVEYYRIPITPEINIKDITIDTLFRITVQKCIEKKPQQKLPYFVINCQMGRGRSTLCSIFIWLIFCKLGLLKKTNNNNNNLLTDSLSPPPELNALNIPLIPRRLFRTPSTPTYGYHSITNSKSSPSLKNMVSLKELKQLKELQRDITSHTKDTTSLQGDYEIIVKILRVLKNGQTAKQDVDSAINECGTHGIYNLNHEMTKSRLRLENSENDDERDIERYRSTSILSKYTTLICFAAFLDDINLNNLIDVNKPYNFNTGSFSSWMNKQVSIRIIRESIPKLTYSDLVRDYSQKLGKYKPNDLIIQKRTGSVLSANTILKNDINALNIKGRRRSFRRLKLNEQLTSVKFRFLNDVGIATCSQPPSLIIETILKSKLGLKLPLNMKLGIDEEKNANLNKKDDDHKKRRGIWIDLREEPVLYIRNTPYVARNYHRPYKRLEEFDHLTTGEDINEISLRLRKDIILEAINNDNKMLVHYESTFKLLKESTLAIDITNQNEIQTTKQVFDSLIKKGYNLSYKKLPFNPQNSYSFDQLDRLGNLIRENMSENNIIIFNDRSGTHRSTVAAVTSILIAYHSGLLKYVDENDEEDEAFKSKFELKDRKTSINEEEEEEEEDIKIPTNKTVKKKKSNASPMMPHQNDPDSSMIELELDEESKENNDDTSDETTGSTLQVAECRAVLGLIRVLRKGLQTKRQVDNAIEHCSEFYHIKESIYDARTKWETARTIEEGQSCLAEAIRHLRVYTNLICYNSYLYEWYHAKSANEDQDKQKYKLVSFTQWMKQRKELTLWSNQMSEDPEKALSMSYSDDHEEKDFKQVFENRGKKASVLSGNAMLKIDYFPGCAQLQALNDAPNAINFRYIDAIGVAGCAIPTNEAIQEVIILCFRFWAQKKLSVKSKNGPIRWICLREEPVLYVNNEPVVLREVLHPYQNLEFTGITAKRVEAMEKTLKHDAIDECKKFENKLLIHGEIDTGNLEAQWEEVTEQNIMTCKESYLYSFNEAQKNINLSLNNMDARYYRFPVTDEQAPTATIIDTFIELFEANPPDSIFIFNCQMGRGRTTTAMVIYSLWKRKCELCTIPSTSHNSPIKNNQNNSNKKNLSNKKDSKLQQIESLINGEWPAVFALLRILPSGIKAKRWCDDVLDVLSHMQNIRKAVYSMKIRSEKATKDILGANLFHRAQNYLQRYCLLIAFASYLLSGDYNYKEKNKSKSFTEWLKERAAVSNCIYSAKLT